MAEARDYIPPFSPDADKSQVPDDTIEENRHPVEEQEGKEAVENWQRMSQTSNKDPDLSEETDWRCLYIMTRISVCFLFFCMVLGSATISLCCLMILTSQLHVQKGVDLVFRHAKGESVTHIDNVTLTTDVNWIFSLLSVICIPYVFTVLDCLWEIITMKTGEVSWKILFKAMIPESVHSIGLTVFVFYVLPSFDPVVGTFLTVCVGTLPGILQIWQPVSCVQNKKLIKLIYTLLVLIHLGVLGLFCFRVYTIRHSVLLTILLPLSLLFISVSWWDNYVKTPTSNSDGHFLESLKLDIGKQRSKTYFWLYLWKITFTVVLTLSYFSRNNIQCFRTLIRLDDKASECMFDGNVNLQGGHQGNSESMMIACVLVFASVICYKTVKWSSMILAQKICFAGALSLSFPITLTLLGYSLVNAETLNDWINAPVIPNYSVRDVSVLTLVKSFTLVYWLPVLFFSVLYLTFCLGCHIWVPKNVKMAMTQLLFQKPLYCGALLYSSLILNRNREEKYIRQNAAECPSGKPPMIYICATMWREEQREMLQLVKSIFRLDRNHTEQAFNMSLYNFEAHIFFDDAFEKKSRVNPYVKQLEEVIQEAAREAFGTDGNYPVGQPKLIETPYGGRMLWTLPNDHRLTVHLKNSSLIRKKKRWSQVMFLYYILKYGILDKKKHVAQNTFILTLDGDVGFQPDALESLVVQMKANAEIGAVCGRIHPVGAGPMAWYQKFEYALSHWLQKAAENTLGCVLCSPGCFSLFRGSALMDANVMASYTQPVKEALQKVQFDLGEDRWLCTLLLQQGHRVEYTAASDSYTFCPEGFCEFFRQRHRWVPSTMVNIFALIMSWKTVTTNNPDISLLFIVYQLTLFICAVVTPGTIFMLVVGALSSAFPDLSLFVSLMINMAPLIIFLILCIRTNQRTQLMFAEVLTLCYCLLMTVVLVGIIKQAAESGLCSISTLFLSGIAGIFVISAALHPQEGLLLLYGPLYFLMIPCMSMLMIIFAVANIDDASWGTRDTNANSQPVNMQMRKMREKLMSWLPCCQSTEHLQHDDFDLQPPTENEEGVCDVTEDAAVESPDDRTFQKKMKKKETLFWKTLITKYLSPLDQTKDKRKQEQKIMDDLRQLRNNVFLGFVLINAVFIVLLFSLESIAEHTPNLAFELPCPGDRYKAEKIQPIAVAFTLVFGIVLVIQFIAMLLHRFTTLLQIVVGKQAMSMACCKKSPKNIELSYEDIRNLVKDYQKKYAAVTHTETDEDSVGEEKLWKDVGDIALDYCKDVKMELHSVIQKKFKILSFISQRTIGELIKRTKQEIHNKDEEDLSRFSKYIQSLIRGTNVDQQRTIRDMFGVRPRPRRRPLRNAFTEAPDDTDL